MPRLRFLHLRVGWRNRPVACLVYLLTGERLIFMQHGFYRGLQKAEMFCSAGWQPRNPSEAQV
jgi:hypothetical protein